MRLNYVEQGNKTTYIITATAITNRPAVVSDTSNMLTKSNDNYSVNMTVAHQHNFVRLFMKA